MKYAGLVKVQVRSTQGHTADVPQTNPDAHLSKTDWRQYVIRIRSP